MGVAIDALTSGVSNVTNNPKVLAISYAVALAMIPVFVVFGVVSVVLLFIPVVGPPIVRLLGGAVIKPLVLGGMVGVVGAGFTGSVGFSDYTGTLKEDFVSLAGAFALYELVVMVVSFVALVVLFVVYGAGFAAMAGMGGGSETAAAGLGLTIVALYGALLVFLVLYAMVFQFIDVAIVLGDKSATEAFEESWRLTREAPLSVLGYSVLRLLVSFVIVLPGYVVAIAGAQVSDVLMYLGFGVVLLLSPVAFTVVMSYHAAYYGHRLRAP